MGVQTRISMWPDGKVLRCCATSRTVLGSIPGGVTGFFRDIFLLTMPWPWGQLGPCWKWVPGTFPGGKGGWCVRMTTSPPSCAECREIWEPKPPGTLRASPGLLRDTFIFYLNVVWPNQLQLTRRNIPVTWNVAKKISVCQMSHCNRKLAIQIVFWVCEQNVFVKVWLLQWDHNCLAQ
jgi:hypothetical protein